MSDDLCVAHMVYPQVATFAVRQPKHCPAQTDRAGYGGPSLNGLSSAEGSASPPNCRCRCSHSATTPDQQQQSGGASGDGDGDGADHGLVPARWLDVVIGRCVGALFAAAMLVVGTVEARRRARQRAADQAARGGPAQHRPGAARIPSPRVREALPGPPDHRRRPERAELHGQDCGDGLRRDTGGYLRALGVILLSGCVRLAGSSRIFGEGEGSGNGMWVI